MLEQNRARQHFPGEGERNEATSLFSFSQWSRLSEDEGLEDEEGKGSISVLSFMTAYTLGRVMSCFMPGGSKQLHH